MSGEAKGQVGGLDMSEDGRKRLARESRGWRCAGGCGGRTNQEVLRECEEEWKAMEGEGGERKEDAVPEELRLEYRDDLERGPPTPRAVPGPSGASIQALGSSPAGAGSIPKSPLVAGPVANLLARSKPPPSPLRATASSSSSFSSPLATSSTPLYQPSTASDRHIMTAAAQTLVPPTPNVIPPTPLPVMATMVPTRTRVVSTPQEVVPWWVDKAIVGVVIGLVLMVIKKISS